MNKILLALLFVLLQFSSMSQNKELRKMYSKGKYDQLIEKAQILLAEKESDPYLNSILGRAYTNSKQFKMAIPYLEKSMNSDLASGEIKAISKAYLAKCYFVMGEEQKAVRYLKECQNGSESKEASRYAHRYLNLFQSGVYYKAWELVETDHIRFHFQDKAKLKDADAYMERMQVNYQRIVSFFDMNPSKKVDIFIWNDRNEAFRKFNKPVGFFNSDLCTVNVWDQELNGYELCHMLSQVALQPKFKSMMLNKGLGVYFDTMDKNLFAIARNRIPKEKFSLLELWEEPTRYERNLSYPVGAAFIEFLLNKEGKSKLKQFLKVQTIKNGQEVYPDFEQLVKTFESMLMR
ncbi:hypothetical protein [Marinifilum caeruleilacunae]|uniref:Tetratricopeptide repeat protein n=1 Tax=Marinifilum caeruleilacunae TaxID=2499076 RepID=A0ABX1WTX0_9BACT|nr:hypothetical protein [Marinifilum caeruleilacunae]NOU59401.1 hypothetical protein [Marinifilum caeruleilacunae]